MRPAQMRLCFIVERVYRHDGMPLRVAEQLLDWGHEVDLLEPDATVTGLGEPGGTPYDAWVLKTVSEGPGVSLLEAASATGVVTINDVRAIRRVRDKAVAAAWARVHGLPFPATWFVTHRGLLEQLPACEYPIVVKPANGSRGRDVRLLRHRDEIDGLDLGPGDCFLLAQRFVPNAGWDVKLYNTGQGIHAVRRPSPLGPRAGTPERPIRVTEELRRLTLEVGRLYGLDIYGVDVVGTERGWTVVDVNDFPSFGHVSDAPAIVAGSILRIAGRAAAVRPVPA
jgi:ribosomal protein S6--L-glutamate ligase